MAPPNIADVHDTAERLQADFKSAGQRPSPRKAELSWATIDPEMLGVASSPYHLSNLVGGAWQKVSKARMEIPHPMDKDAPAIFSIPDTQIDELAPFIASLEKVPKSGVHNPLKHNDRYVHLGEVSRKVCAFSIYIYVLFYFSKPPCYLHKRLVRLW